MFKSIILLFRAQFQICKIYVWGIDMGNRYLKKKEHLFGPSNVMNRPWSYFRKENIQYYFISAVYF